MSRRYAIFVHDPDGDSGWGAIVGPFRSVEAADAKADLLRIEGEHKDVYIECIVLPIVPNSASVRKLVLAISDPMNFTVPS